jgi:hypothetical protein
VDEGDFIVQPERKRTPVAKTDSEILLISTATRIFFVMEHPPFLTVLQNYTTISIGIHRLSILLVAE